jgi:hypothetical protein
MQSRTRAAAHLATQALNYSVQDGSNLRVADLSYNHICELELGSGLCQHTRLRQLVLDGNRIARLQSSSLAQLRALRQLSLCGNALRTCSGLEGGGAGRGGAKLQATAVPRLCDSHRCLADTVCCRCCCCGGGGCPQHMHTHQTGLTSLRELSLDANGITSLAALSRLSGLQALTAAHNQLGSLEGVQVCLCGMPGSDS